MQSSKDTYFPLVNEDRFSERLLAHSEFRELVQSALDMQNLNGKEKMSIIKARLMNKNITLKPYQEYVSRFISSFTPYESLLLFHSPGSGKTLSLLNILKNNIEYFVNQNSFVYIFVPRRLLKMQWVQSIERYFPELANYIVLSTYKSLYNKILGERRVVLNEVTLKRQRKHSRELSSLEVSYSEYENSILVFEEAHNVTNNNYTLAINKLLANVNRKKVICLTATPIKNMIDEIVDLFNFLHKDRKLEKSDYFSYVDGRPILRDANALVRDMTGYVSTLNINDSPFLARRIQIGQFVDGLKTIKIIKIKCHDNYRKIIDRIVSSQRDSLGRIFESLSNIIFPYFINGKLTFLYGNRGYELLVNELLQNSREFNKSLCQLLGIADTIQLLSLVNSDENTKDSRRLTGKLFTRKYINIISPKMRFLYDLIERLDGNIFIYSSYKKVFIDLFSELLLNEGYQDYSNPERGFDALKRCYMCNATRHAHTSLSHAWSPKSFLIVDSANPDLMDAINTYNMSTNMDGRRIKIILASVMVNEGISLKNTIHMINVDAQPTMSRKDQIELRVIRLDSHDDFILRNNKIPDVFVYNLALYHEGSSIPSIEVYLYKLAESKNEHVKELYKLIERASIDYGVYNNKISTENVNLINTTRSLVNKDSRVDSVIKYVLSIFSNVSVVSYSALLSELQVKFNEVSIFIAMRHMIEQEKLFVVSMNDSTYIFGNSVNVPESVDERFLDIHSYYKKEVTKLSDDLYYDMDYIESKNANGICGILSTKFKLRISNEIIDQLKLDFVQTKKDQKQTMKGWICSQSIGRHNLAKLVEYFEISDKIENTSKVLCDHIYNKLYNLEKYSDNNVQFLIYPKNYPGIPIILNIYDRVNITSIQYESKGYQVERKKHTTKEFVHLSKSIRYPVVTFELTCVKTDEQPIKITID